MGRIDNRWYDDLADSWWDRDGPVAALHEVNPVRGGYFLDVLGLETGGGARPRILDLGCGGGLMAEIYAGAGAGTVGIDPSRQSLQAARRHHGQLANPLYLAGRGEELPFADATFDAVCAADSLEHVAQLERVLDECVRVLRPGGRLLVADFAPHRLENMREEHAHRRLGFGDEEVTRWYRETGLEIETIRAMEGEPLTVKIWTAVKSPRRPPDSRVERSQPDHREVASS